MKPIAWERLLALVIALSAGRVGRAFVAPTAVVSSSRRGENKGLASSATACEDITEAKSAVGQEVLDFAIVGGGPAGLAAAVGLKEKGLAVKVFEAAPRITERGAAVFLQVGVVFLPCVPSQLRLLYTCVRYRLYAAEQHVCTT